MALIPLLFLLAVSPTVHGSDVALQNVINTASYLSKQTGISLAVAMPDRTVSLATGLKDRQRMKYLQPEDRMGLGSATKMFTAAAVLKAVEGGQVRLDDLALPHVDPLVRSITGKSLLGYLGPQMRNVTVRHMLHMTSGIGDFDSTARRNQALQDTGSELDTHELLGEGMSLAAMERHQANPDLDQQQMFSCDPGSCGEYSSTNYFLAGMMLAQLHGKKHWMDYDQSAFLPSGLRQRMPRTVFPMKGQSREFTDVHGYTSATGMERSKLLTNGRMIDNHEAPANNAFAVANALSTSTDVATFLRAMLGHDKEVLRPQSIKEMTKLRWLESGAATKISAGQFYGMGMRDLSAQMSMQPMLNLVNPEIFMSGLLLGHDGTAMGWNSFNAYAPRHDFALSFMMNMNHGASFYNFITRKAYDISSAMTTPVDEPLKATYEGKDAFLNQKIFRTVRRLMNTHN